MRIRRVDTSDMPSIEITVELIFLVALSLLKSSLPFMSVDNVMARRWSLATRTMFGDTLVVDSSASGFEAANVEGLFGFDIASGIHCCYRTVFQSALDGVSQRGYAVEARDLSPEGVGEGRDFCDELRSEREIRLGWRDLCDTRQNRG